MKSFAPVILCLLALGLARADDPTIKLAGVSDLTPSNFDSLVNGQKAALVEFYAPWCGHCKRMTPEYKKLGEMVQADPVLKNRVVVAKVDADAHRELGERFGVQGFPTIKFFPRGQKPDKDNAVAYNNARTADAFLEYLKEAVQKDGGFARVEALDAIAAKLVSDADQAAVVEELKSKVAELSGDDATNGALYVKMAEKAVEKGSSWLGKEKARLEKMLATGHVAAAKSDEMTKKVSVLGAFVEEESS